MALKSKKKVFVSQKEYDEIENASRQDVKLFVAGIVFSFTLLKTMMALGDARGWNARSPLFYDDEGQESYD